MSQNSKIAKMFGALVLGGGMLMTSSTNATPPKSTDIKEAPPESTRGPESAGERDNTPPVEKGICQLAFALTKYSESPPTRYPICLDGKSDTEILKIIKEAKDQTCQSPFCGCWLG